LLYHIAKEGGWPLGEEWTGNFSAVSFDAINERISFCCDILGNLPFYYRLGSGFVCRGTSLILMSRGFTSSIDTLGMLQRIHPYYPCCGANFGRRTLIREIKRLLPGERLVIETRNFTIRKDYDNSLCKEAINGDIDELAELTWNLYKNELQLATMYENKLYVALSGGWDSRLILAGLMDTSSVVNCITYGANDVYEVKVAKRCAEVAKKNIINFPLSGEYFPSRQKLEKIIRKVEVAYFLNYLCFFRDFILRDKNTILVGDLCDSITGKGMRSLYERDKRLKFSLYDMVGTKMQFERANEKNFNKWKEEVTKTIRYECLKFRSELNYQYVLELSSDQLAADLMGDLELDFRRIEQNSPKFRASFEELFTWFHYTRFGMGSQLMTLNYGFSACCHPMSIRFLRFISRIPPDVKISRRLMDRICCLRELRQFARVPSAQVPIVDFRAPKAVRDVVWGVRAYFDDYYMRRALKNKSKFGKKFLVGFHDYSQEYTLALHKF
jgi:hypothetical protein